MLRSRGQKKNLIVVAVSSPYDFAMDKSIGTYICTFDFTENAMHALVRALVGEFTPLGSLPGTLRKSKKVLKSRQHWLVEDFDKSRDRTGLEDLLRAVHRASAPDLQFLKTTTASTFELSNPNITEAHFVVRNSSTRALYGFVATYYTAGVGVIGSLFVDPTKRNVSIGRSLHRRAIKNLTQRPGIQKVRIGMSFPGVFLGIPQDIEINTVKEWFATSGWDTQFPRRLTNMVINDLPSWSTPEGLQQSVQRANISFDLIHGLDNADSVLNHVRANANPEVMELYRFALAEAKACGIVRAKDGVDNLVGTIIVARPGSPLIKFMPPLLSHSEEIGGILAPVVLPGPLATLTLQGLTWMGLRQIKSHKAAKALLSLVSVLSAVDQAWLTKMQVVDDTYEPLLGMGFEIQQVFEEITNSPDNVRLLTQQVLQAAC
jgi:beta-N-acetylhexosaminidase